jgi:SPP1 family predicted phage head-tail adaptor
MRGAHDIAARRMRLLLEAPVLTPDSAGGGAHGWSLVAAVFAAVRFSGGDERWRADRPEQAARHEISIRWRAGVTAGMRFRAGARSFGILSAGDPDGSRRWLACICEEIAP